MTLDSKSLRPILRPAFSRFPQAQLKDLLPPFRFRVFLTLVFARARRRCVLYSLFFVLLILPLRNLRSSRGVALLCASVTRTNAFLRGALRCFLFLFFFLRLFLDAGKFSQNFDSLFRSFAAPIQLHRKYAFDNGVEFVARRHPQSL